MNYCVFEAFRTSREHLSHFDMWQHEFSREAKDDKDEERKIRMKK